MIQILNRESLCQNIKENYNSAISLLDLKLRRIDLIIRQTECAYAAVQNILLFERRDAHVAISNEYFWSRHNFDSCEAREKITTSCVGLNDIDNDSLNDFELIKKILNQPM